MPIIHVSKITWDLCPLHHERPGKRSPKGKTDGHELWWLQMHWSKEKYPFQLHNFANAEVSLQSSRKKRRHLLWVQLQWRGKCFALMNNYHLRTILSLPLLYLQNSFSDLNYEHIYEPKSALLSKTSMHSIDDLGLKEKLIPVFLDF